MPRAGRAGTGSFPCAAWRRLARASATQSCPGTSAGRYQVGAAPGCGSAVISGHQSWSQSRGRSGRAPAGVPVRPSRSGGQPLNFVRARQGVRFTPGSRGGGHRSLRSRASDPRKISHLRRTSGHGGTRPSGRSTFCRLSRKSRTPQSGSGRGEGGFSWRGAPRGISQ